MLDRLGAAYRRTGADVPFGDPRPSHGAEMEGWFWRFTDAAVGRVVVALCGVNRSPDGDWATVALAAHPGGLVKSAAVAGASASRDRFAVSAGDVFTADESSVRVDFRDGGGAAGDISLDARLVDPVGWPRRFLHGGGVASVVPFLNQYWHPHVLGGRVEGTATVRGERWDLGSSTVYAERNWGRGFPPFWWWGQAQAFERPDVCVAFSGGHLALGPIGASVSGIVVRVGDRVIRLAPPTALVTGGFDADSDRWVLHGTNGRSRVTIVGRPRAGVAPHVLPVPLPAERRNVFTDVEHLAGSVTLEVRHRGRVLFEGTSTLAGLEHGRVDPHAASQAAS